MGMKTVLITGADGFLGQSLIRRLEKNSKIRLKLFGSRYRLADKKKLSYFLKGCDDVVHFAGVANPSDPNIFESNVIGLVDLLDVLCKVAPSCRLIFPSSFSVYRIPKRGEIIDEKFEVSPRNKYGLTKLISEEILTYYNKVYGIKSIILRMSNVYGTGMRPFAHSVVATFVELMKTNKKITIDGKGFQTRDFLYIEDAMEAMEKVLGFKKEFAVVNICSGREISIIGLVRVLEDVMGKKVELIFREVNGLVGGYWRGDNRLAGHFLNWEPATDLKDGISDMIGDK